MGQGGGRVASRQEVRVSEKKGYQRAGMMMMSIAAGANDDAAAQFGEVKAALQTLVWRLRADLLPRLCMKQLGVVSWIRHVEVQYGLCSTAPGRDRDGQRRTESKQNAKLRESTHERARESATGDADGTASGSRRLEAFGGRCWRQKDNGEGGAASRTALCSLLSALCSLFSLKRNCHRFAARRQ